MLRIFTRALDARFCAIQAVFLAAAFTSISAQARLLQIIHTNDLHSHLDHAMDPERGGYASVKAAIDKLKWDARLQGIDTLVLDAGDFSEDSQYYLADRGLQAWKAMDAMGYDAVTIGNHDWLMGPKALNEVIGRAQPSFAFLGANFLYGWEDKNLLKYMRQWVEVVRAGAKIAIYGLTTDDPQYSWMARPSLIYKPTWRAQEDLPKLRARNDYVIALTHLGVSADKQLIKTVKGIDLVVGGHSHTTLEKIVEQADPTGKVISIVQTGAHGNFVGDLLVDVDPGKPLQVLHYNLVPVYSKGPQDAAMTQIIAQARTSLDADYGADWLSEVVGSSEVPLLNAYYQNAPTVWSRFVGQAILEASHADAAIDVTEFEGYDFPAGPITREQLFVMYPRIFEFERRRGYTIWNSTIRGWVLEFAIKEAYSLELPISLVGITADLDADGKPTAIKLNGQPIQSMRNYTIALPEALARGAYGISKYLKLAIKNAQDTGISIWGANEDHLKKIGGVIKKPPPVLIPEIKH